MSVNALDVVTGAVALYGALLATAVFLKQLRSRQTRLRVGAWLGAAMPVGGNERCPESVVVTIANVGEVDALVAALGTVLTRPAVLWRFHGRWRRHGVIPAPQLEGKLPKKLSPSEQVTLLLPADEFLPSLSQGAWGVANTRLLAQDSRGKYHYSPPLSKCLPAEAASRYECDAQA